MTTYDAKLGLPIAFPKETYPDIFPEVIARAGLTQFRCAETEKYAHVTYFFNGGREEAFEGEERVDDPLARRRSPPTITSRRCPRRASPTRS